MNVFARIDRWGEKHHPIWIEFIRILLGFVLILKGFYFMHTETALVSHLEQWHFGQWSLKIAFLLPFVNILAGVLMVVGLQTRMVILFQIPILFVAVFFVNMHYGLLSGNTELLFSITVLGALILFLIEGPGQLSLDYHLKKGRLRNAKDKIIRSALPGKHLTNPDGQ